MIVTLSLDACHFYKSAWEGCSSCWRKFTEVSVKLWSALIASLKYALTLGRATKEDFSGFFCLLCAHLIVPLENILTLGRATKEDFSGFFFCFALT